MKDGDIMDQKEIFTKLLEKRSNKQKYQLRYKNMLIDKSKLYGRNVTWTGDFPSEVLQH